MQFTRRSMRLLIAEDDPVSRRLLEARLGRWGYDVEAAADGVEAWRRLQEQDAPRLAILDWMMPGLTGPEVCRKLRKLASEPYTYILLLTARRQKEDLVAGLDAGADDYITKPFDENELKVRLRAGRRILELQAELVAAREALREQATHDGLTALWNRSSILGILEREVARAEREGTSVGVLMLDLDHFKSVNDTYGHAAGDEVLAEAARRMLASVRPYDAVGRYGGEEFLLVLPGCLPEYVSNLAERLCAALRQEPVRFLGRPIRFTGSIGGAVSRPGAGAPPNELLREADEALFEAKRRGRDRVCLSAACLHALQRDGEEIAQLSEPAFL